MKKLIVPLMTTIMAFSFIAETEPAFAESRDAGPRTIFGIVSMGTWETTNEPWLADDYQATKVTGYGWFFSRYETAELFVKMLFQKIDKPLRKVNQWARQEPWMTDVMAKQKASTRVDLLSYDEGESFGVRILDMKTGAFDEFLFSAVSPAVPPGK